MKKTDVLPESDLVLNGVYFDTKGCLVKIISLDEKKNEMHTHNLSEQYKSYFIKLDKHNMVKRIR